LDAADSHLGFASGRSRSKDIAAAIVPETTAGSTPPSRCHRPRCWSTS